MHARPRMHLLWGAVPVHKDARKGSHLLHCRCCTNKHHHGAWPALQGDRAIAERKKVVHCRALLGVFVVTAAHRCAERRCTATYCCCNNRCTAVTVPSRSHPQTRSETKGSITVVYRYEPHFETWTSLFGPLGGSSLNKMAF